MDQELVYNEKQRFPIHTNIISELHDSAKGGSKTEEDGKNERSKTDKSNKASKTEKKTKAMLHNYIASVNPQFSEVCPSELLSVRRSCTDTLYLFEPSTAKKFTAMIIDDLLKNPSYVAEGNPGMGTLTTELLKAGVPVINLYEINTNFYPTLQQLQQQYPERLILHAKKLFALKTFSSRSVPDLPIKKWEDETSVQMIGVASGRFIRRVSTEMIFRNGFMTSGRAKFYIAIPPSEWKPVTYTGIYKHYTKSSIFFQILFDYEILGTLNRNSFVPWQKNKLSKSTLDNVNDDEPSEFLYVIKIEAKANFFNEHLNEKDLIVFYHFISNYLTARSNRVIPCLEKWIPGCGPRLIAEGFTIFTAFGDLKADELLTLFKKITHWPEYKINSKVFFKDMDLLIQDNELFVDEKDSID